MCKVAGYPATLHALHLSSYLLKSTEDKQINLKETK
jgi:hypothetical protein